MTETEPVKCAEIVLSALLDLEVDAPEEIRPDSAAVMAVTEGLPRIAADSEDIAVKFGCAAAGGVCRFAFTVSADHPLTPPPSEQERQCLQSVELLLLLEGLRRETFGDGLDD